MVNIFRNMFGSKSSGGGNSRINSTGKFDSDAAQKKIKEGISKEVEGYLSSKKLSGNMQGQQREISDNAKKMLEVLAQRKLQKEVKTQEKKEAADAKKMTETVDKKQKMIRQNAATQDTSAQQSSKSYFFGTPEEPV